MKTKPANEEVYSNYSKHDGNSVVVAYFVHTKRTEPQHNLDLRLCRTSIAESGSGVTISDSKFSRHAKR